METPPVLKALIERGPNKEERCGYFFKGQPTTVNNVVELPNVADKPNLHFEFSLEDTMTMLELELEDIVLWHSHLGEDENTLSYYDVLSADSTGLPMFMVNVATGITDFYDPTIEVPYLGREYVFSYQNCYSLVEDFYLKEFSIELPKIYLKYPNEYRSKDWNPYTTELPKYFKEIKLSAAKRGDLILMKIGKTFNPNHIGIVSDPVKNTFLHHLTDRISSEDILNQPYRNRIVSVHRHLSND